MSWQTVPGPKGLPVQLRLGNPAPGPSPLAPEGAPLPAREPSRLEITGAKGSIFYRAHSYHTKVPPEGIASVIEHFTELGAWVLDPFCGSGMTGVACLMTGRRGMLSDLSPAAVHIARNYIQPLDPARLMPVATALLSTLAQLEADLYGIVCPECRQPALVEYTVWSDRFLCPQCSGEIEFWSTAVEPSGSIRNQFDCPSCGQSFAKRDLTWLDTVPVIQSVSCRSCRRRHERELSVEQRAAWSALTPDQVPFWYPTTEFASWREMWRGQHREQGIKGAADFFTSRNLWALAALWNRVGQEPDPRMNAALKFLFTSVVNRASRRYQWNAKRPTNVLSSTMYVASLSYEFNVFSLLRRKVRAVVDLYSTTWDMQGSAEVRLSPAQSLQHIPERSIDYVFTDPPFGSNIFYADSSFLWEAWLGEETDVSWEAVVNKSVDAEHGGKSLADYEELMAGAFAEINRVLRTNGWVSVMFHNSDDQVWSGLQRAIETAGFEISGTVAFDKSQPSFKGIKGLTAGERVPSFDLMLHLKRRSTRSSSQPAKDSTAKELLIGALTEHVGTASPSRRTTPYLHSLAMRVLLEERMPLGGYTYKRIETLCQRLFEWDGQGWRLRRTTEEAMVRR